MEWIVLKQDCIMFYEGLLCVVLLNIQTMIIETLILLPPLSQPIALPNTIELQKRGTKVLWGLFNLFVTHFLIVYEGTRSKMSCENYLLGCENVVRKQMQHPVWWEKNYSASSERSCLIEMRFTMLNSMKA